MKEGNAMKKIYSKPEIAFESFSLSANIAAGCETKTDTPSKMQCGYGEDDFGMPLFVQGASGCKAIVQENAGDTLCYHVPTDTNNLFNS